MSGTARPGQGAQCPGGPPPAQLPPRRGSGAPNNGAALWGSAPSSAAAGTAGGARGAVGPRAAPGGCGCSKPAPVLPEGTFWPCCAQLREAMLLLLVPAWDAELQLGQKGLKREEKEITAPQHPVPQPAPETKQTSPEQRVPHRQLSATGCKRHGEEENLP